MKGWGLSLRSLIFDDTNSSTKKRISREFLPEMTIQEKDL